MLDWNEGGSGYNEVIINSAKYNAQLPAVVDAFFILKGQGTVTTNEQDEINIDLRRAHRKFLSKYRKTAQEVPLLVFDPFNWTEPFSTFAAK